MSFVALLGISKYGVF